MALASWQLCLGIVAFYLFDSIRLLFRNEVIFSESGGRWHVHFADDRWVMFGKCLYLPNPLTPWRAPFRTSWSPAAKPAAKALLPLASLWPLRVLVAVVSGLLLIVLPIALLRLSAFWQLCALVSCYLLIISLLAILWRRRDLLSLSAHRWRQLALDALICPPFALNTLRKLTFDAPMSLDAVEIARHVLDKAQLAAFVTTLLARLDIELQWLEDGDDAIIGLNRYRQQLQEMLA